MDVFLLIKRHDYKCLKFWSFKLLSVILNRVTSSVNVATMILADDRN